MARSSRRRTLENGLGAAVSGRFSNGSPFWLVFCLAILTIVSGLLHVRKYSDLLKKEFAVLKTVKTS